MTETAQPDIVVVEDNPNDVELLFHALHANGVSWNIRVVRDGAEALEYFFGSDGKEGANLAGLKLVLIDVKLPKVDGLEVLKQLKADSRTRPVPVVMLSTSQSEHDIMTVISLAPTVTLRSRWILRNLWKQSVTSWAIGPSVILCR